MSRWRPPDGFPVDVCRPLAQRRWQLIVLFTTILGIASSASNSPLKLPCPPYTQDGDIVVDCSDQEFDYVPHVLNPGLVQLKLVNSRIKSVSNIDVYVRMRHLDLTRNFLTALGEPLSNLHNLSVVIVRENKFTSLRRSDLAGLRSLTRLDIAKNHITSIEKQTFINSSLVELDLSENSLSELSQGSLQGLTKLQRLNLKDNKFITVPTSLTKLRLLNYLDLSFNSFGDIPAGVLPDVKTLRLERCDLSNTSFLYNSSATFLDISSNRFSTIPRPLPAKLETLIFDANPIQILTARSLSHVPNLSNLSISSSQELRSIHADTFAGNSDIREIRLESNVNLKVLDSKMFRSLGKLQIISFRESGLRSIDAGFMSWYLLKRVDFRDNPFKCDCSLSWLRDLTIEYLNSTGKPANERPGPLDNETIHISCAEPTKFTGRKLYELPAIAFECGMSSLFLSVIVPLVILALLVSVGIITFLYWRHHRLPAWLPCLRSKDKTAPVHNGSTKHQYLEKTYMVPGDDYDGIYHLQRNAPVRLIPVTEL
ncbi:protein slit-like isoform X2 [Varroa jacobsoni]|nr:protein slit-like isoform X2 [Varroa jacobsoni]